MKNILKKTGLLMCLCLGMLLIMPFTLQAALAYTITINNPQPGHTYEAYQIFAGRLQNTDKQETTLSDIVWGSGVSGNDLQTALAKTAPFTSIKSAADAAKILEQENTYNTTREFANTASKYLSTPAASSVREGNLYKITGLDAGYYLIKDKDQSVNGHDAYTEYMVKVVGNASMTPKTGLPAMIKKVNENKRPVTVHTDAAFPNLQLAAQENDTADYSISEPISYTLIGSLPQNLNRYSKYAYTFHDSMAPGLTLANPFTVEAVAADGTKTDITKFFKKTSTVGANSTETSYACPDILLAGVKDPNTMIYLHYTAMLNEKAVVGVEGNKNTAWLEFSNNPNPSHEGETGQTPPDHCVVFTYGLTVKKVDKDNNEIALANAQFTLQNEQGRYAMANASNKITGWTTIKNTAKKFKTGADGTFQITGLDDGQYTLTETTPPAGYSSHPAPIVFDIKANLKHVQTYNGSQSSHDTLLSSITVSTQGTNSVSEGGSGVGSLMVADAKGSILPETGGQGSTAMVAFGLICAGAGALYFIMRKKPAGSKQ